MLRPVRDRALAEWAAPSKGARGQKGVRSPVPFFLFLDFFFLKEEEKDPIHPHLWLSI
jgi:hypothetical protein